MLISSPHDVMSIIVAYIHESDEESQKIRYIIARYLVLYCALGYRNISSKIRKYFPTNDRYVEIGLLTQEEKEIIDSAPKGVAHEIVYQWILEIVRDKVGNQQVILNNLEAHRSKMKQLGKYNDIALPLVYTQTVTISVYGYFTMAIIGHQFYHLEPNTFDLYFPFLTMLRFFFGIGWLKVAEYLSKPFGDDDDDIDLCKALSVFGDNVFTIASQPIKNKPWKSWKSGNDVKYEKFKAAFQAGITTYVHMGEVIVRNLKKCCTRGEREIEMSRI